MSQSLVEKLLDDDNDEVIELIGEDGQPVRFEQIAVVMCEEVPYAIMRPMTMSADQVVVFRIDEYDEGNLEFVDDVALATKVLQVLHDETK